MGIEEKNSLDEDYNHTIRILKKLNYSIDKIGDSLMIVKSRAWSFCLGKINGDGSVKIYSYALYSPDLIFDRFSLREHLREEGINYAESGIDEARETLKQQKSQIEKILARL